MSAESTVQVLSSSHILIFLIQFFVLLSLAKLLGLVFLRIKQPTVTADIIVGLVLGPSVLGRFFPGLHHLLFPADPFQIDMLDTVSWLGIFFLLLVTGLEVNFSGIWKQKGKAFGIAITDIILPLLLAAGILFFIPAHYLVDPSKRGLFTLFIAAIMTISAMTVSIRVMQDSNLLRTDLGFLTVSALSINDLLGWVVFSIILGLFAHGSPDLSLIATVIVLTTLFILFAVTIGKSVIAALISLVNRKVSDPTGLSLTIVTLTGLAFGAIAQSIGIEALFGFFLAGLVAGEARDLSERTRSIISRIVDAVFIPLFFANVGLKIDILHSFDLGLIVLFTVVGIGVRFVGAFAGVWLTRAPRAYRWPVAALHTPGGEMHIVIGTIALQLGLINETVYVAIIIAAIVSSITLGPWVTLIISHMIPKETLQIKLPDTLEITAQEKYTALRQLCEKAAHNGKLDSELVCEAARNREEGMSTGLEHGLAIPHARLPEATEPLVVFGRSEDGIDWNSPDGKPAQLIFFIVTPADETDVQLRIYRQLMRVLARPENRAALVDAPSLKGAVDLLNTQLRLMSFTSLK